MGSAYNRVIETRKELTKQLLAEMEQGELPWMRRMENNRNQTV